MLTLINTNRMQPPIAPVGLDHVATAVEEAGLDVDLLDLGLSGEEPETVLARYFSRSNPRLIGLTFRNVDDCFWPGGSWYVPELAELIQRLRRHSDAPIVVGGVGYSIFARDILSRCGADFGVHGDGEPATVGLLRALRGELRFDQVPGLLWRDKQGIVANRPAWPDHVRTSGRRTAVDNPRYLRLGGQIGLETKRGCPRRCAYCADPLAKGNAARLRDPAVVADEAEHLLHQGVDVLHLCDAEFNLPPGHALEVCDEFIRRGLGRRMRWYAYLAVVPLDRALIENMAAAGCAGINFTSDAASPRMLSTYRQPHEPDDLRRAVALCKAAGVRVMLDLLLGGPGETPDTLAESIRFFKQIDPDGVGAALGLRIYPGTAIHRQLVAEGPMESSPALRRHYDGRVELVRPTFYISPAIGPHPARLVRELIGGDSRFFQPEDDGPVPSGNLGDDTTEAASGDHNYNANRALLEAIAAGERGAYWDILLRSR